MEEHPLMTRFPEDADWEQFDNLTLRRQCLVRNIPNDQTTRNYKIRVLQEYQKTHVTEIRQIPWCGKPHFPTWKEGSSRLGLFDTYQIAQVKDRSTSNGTGFRKDFTFCDKEGWTCIVAFQEIPTCTCRSQATYNCVHIMCQLYIQCPDVYKCPDPDTDGESPDLLRFVLSCPEHILWQAAFLPSEVEVIYRHSRAIRTLLPTDNKAQDPVCVLCFKSGVGRKVTCCGTCGKAVHRDCLRVVIKVRKPKPPGSCWMCEDSSEWEIEKYREQNQEPAATTTATITSALPTQTANVIQQPFERKENDDHSVESSSSPKNQDHRDAQVDGNPEINQSPSHGTIVTEEDKMSEDELDGEGNAEGELEQEQDEDIEMGDTHPSPSLSSSSDFPSPSQSAVKQQELLTLPHAQHPSQASKDALPRLMNLTPLPTVPLQRSASVSLTSNLEPMSLELKHQKEQERVEKLPRGVSLDFSPALANSWTSVALGGHTSGQTPVLSAVGIDSQDSASATAAVTVQTATSASPGATPGVVDGPCPVNTTADVRQRKAAKLVRKCRRLEKEASYIGKRAKRRIKKIHKEYKRELKMLKEKRERLERKLKAID